MRRGSAGADGSTSLSELSDHPGPAGATSLKKADPAEVDEDGFQRVQPRRRIKVFVGSDKASKLHVMAKQFRRKARFLFLLHPETTCEDIFEAVSNILGSQRFSCAKVLSK